MTPTGGSAAAEAAEAARTRPRESAAEPLFQVEDLSVSFSTEEGRIRVVEEVSFAVEAGKTVGLLAISTAGVLSSTARICCASTKAPCAGCAATGSA
jgi:ABC-type glutathione transport system ATPase component